MRCLRALALVIALLAGSAFAAQAQTTTLSVSNDCYEECSPGTWETLTITVQVPKKVYTNGVESTVSCTTTVYLRRKVCAYPEQGAARVIMYIDGICSDCGMWPIDQFLRNVINRAFEIDNPFGAFVNTAGMTTNTYWVTRGCWYVAEGCGPNADKTCMSRCNCNTVGPQPIENGCTRCCVIVSTMTVGSECDMGPASSRQARRSPVECDATLPDNTHLTGLGCPPAQPPMECSQACPFPERPSR